MGEVEWDVVWWAGCGGPGWDAVERHSAGLGRTRLGGTGQAGRGGAGLGGVKWGEER
jgi:hypothetical protein